MKIINHNFQSTVPSCLSVSGLQSNLQMYVYAYLFSIKIYQLDMHRIVRVEKI